MVLNAYVHLCVCEQSYVLVEFIIQEDQSKKPINLHAYNFSTRHEDNIVAAAGISNAKPHRVVMYSWMGCEVYTDR